MPMHKVPPPASLLLLLSYLRGWVDAAQCDLAGCTCDGVDLSGMKGKVYQAPPDSEGYAYKISMCSEIPAETLPTGCQQYAEHPAVVKYKANNPADCIEIGSIGPCSQGECGMAGAKTANGITVTYTYTYGCKNTFAISLTAGSDPAPGPVTSDECAYSVAWAGLQTCDVQTVAQQTLLVEQTCCPNGACNGGRPSTCTHSCADVFTPYYDTCGTFLANVPGTSWFADFYNKCKDAAEVPTDQSSAGPLLDWQIMPSPCASGYAYLTDAEAEANAQQICGQIGDWSVVEVSHAGGPGVGGAGYGCQYAPDGCASPCTGAVCKRVQRSCILIDTDGDEWDFSGLGGPKSIVGPPQSSLYGDWTYYWDFCATVTPPSPPLCSSVSTTVAYRLEDYVGTGALCQQLGPDYYGDIILQKIGGTPASGVEVTFSHGAYSMRMTIMNDEEAGTETLPDPPPTGFAAVSMNWNICLSCLGVLPPAPPPPYPPPPPPPPFRPLITRTIVCADPAWVGNPQDCSFTAPETGSFSFVFVTSASFDLVGQGALDRVTVGPRFGTYWTRCCGVDRNEPCKFEDVSIVRYAGTCLATDEIAPTMGNATAARTLGESLKAPGALPQYTGMVVRVDLVEGQSVTLLTRSQGLM